MLALDSDGPVLGFLAFSDNFDVDVEISVDEELPGSNARDDGFFLLLAFGASAHKEREACTWTSDDRYQVWNNLRKFNVLQSLKMVAYQIGRDVCH